MYMRYASLFNAVELMCGYVMLLVVTSFFYALAS